MLHRLYYIGDLYMIIELPTPLKHPLRRIDHFDLYLESENKTLSETWIQNNALVEKNFWSKMVNTLAKGVFIDKLFNNNIIYEKSVADVNGNWWSLRFDTPTDRVPATNQWIFSFSGQRVTLGESIFGSIVMEVPCHGAEGWFRQ